MNMAQALALASADDDASAAGAESAPDEEGGAVRITDFEVLRVVGRGGFGKVMQVVKIDTGQVRGGQTKYFLSGAPKNHDHYGLSIFCMVKHQ
jgi:hypothetical protein